MYIFAFIIIHEDSDRPACGMVAARDFKDALEKLENEYEIAEILYLAEYSAGQIVEFEYRTENHQELRKYLEDVVCSY